MGPESVASTPTAYAENNLDICNIIGQKVSAEEKYKYLTEYLKPPPNFKYPVKTEGRQTVKFQHVWLKDYTWLVYSQKQDNLYCMPCVLFSGPYKGKHSAQNGCLDTRPFCKYKEAPEIFKKHSNTDHHNDAMSKMTKFLSSYETEKIELIKSNREMLIPIIKTIMLCGRENIPLRSYHDDKSLSDEIDLEKFGELLKFRIDSGDSSLEQHLAQAKSMYLKKTTIIQLIDICHSVIVKKVLHKVKEAKYYAIIVDKTTDASGTEQLILSIRYLDIQKSKIYEQFICYLSAAALSDSTLSNEIIRELDRFDMKIDYLRGQGYDGDANKFGKFYGVLCGVKQLQPLATSMHCATHNLNLAIVTTCSMPSVRNMMDLVNSVTSFMREPAKSLELMKSVCAQPEAKTVMLQCLGKPHWLETHDALIKFNEHFNSIVQFLEEIDKISPSSKSANLLASIQRFDFVLTLTLTSAVSGTTYTLSKQLQNVVLDLGLCCELVESIIRTLESYREIKYDEIFQEAYRKAQILKIPVHAPRTELNVEVDAKEYYRLRLFLPYVDFVLGLLRSRFSRTDHSSILHLYTLVPSAIVKAEDLTPIVEAARVYNDDLPHPSSLAGEITHWKEFWSDKEDLPETVTKAHEEANEFFPNIKVLLQILATLPISRFDSSSSKLTKSYVHTMSEDRLNGLAAMYIHRDIFANLQPDEILEEFATSCLRRPGMQ